MPELGIESISHTPLIVCLTSHGSSSILVIAIKNTLVKGFSIIFSWKTNTFRHFFHWITDFNKFPEEFIWSNDIYSLINLGYNLAQTYLQSALNGTRRCCHCLSSFKQNLTKKCSLKIGGYEVKITGSPSRACHMTKRIFLR